LGFGTYKKNIGGDGIVTTHITIGNFAQDAQFTVKHNYRYVLVAYYHIQTIYLDSVYTIYETFPGTISDTLIYRVIPAFNPLAGPPFYHFYTANIPTRMDSVTLTCWDSTSTGIENTFTNLPTEFILRQNYPNPFNPSTCISFNIPTKSFVSLRIFDLIGREVATLVSEEMSAGSYSKQFNANTLPSGVYFYRLQAGLFTETKKLILLR
jgi:hypothetical protein